MKKKAPITFLLSLLLLLLAVGSVLAMSSTNYGLNWFVPFSSGGGSAASSTNYQANITIGQSAVGAVSSTNYQIGIGYWPAFPFIINSYLPVIRK
jgi:membrane-bound metal-dependent hydrolase YbcI (DUF457 family)